MRDLQRVAVSPAISSADAAAGGIALEQHLTSNGIAGEVA